MFQEIILRIWLRLTEALIIVLILWKVGIIQEFLIIAKKRINYVNGDCDEEIFRCSIEASYYDRFLYVDGKLIDFAEFRPSWDDGVFTTSDVSGGKVYTLECKGSYAGQEVHLKTSVTVTAKK